MNGIPFWKMSGSGNDFIIMDHRAPLHPFIDTLSARQMWISRVCRRGLSVGADGVILVEPAATGGSYAWHYYNADGGEADMCGNGARCVARFAYLNQIAEAKHTFETRKGLVEAEVVGEQVRIGLPGPSDFRLGADIALLGKTYEGGFVNTGVPHWVSFVDNLDDMDVVALGRAARYHPKFSPQGTNANFAMMIGKDKIRIRTYERGVENETLACGTGCVAAAVVATRLGQVSPPVFLTTQSGGVVTVDFRQREGQITDLFLSGDARVVFKGNLTEEAWRE